MAINHLVIKFESNNKVLEVGSSTLYGLLNVEGIDSPLYELSTTANSFQDGSRVDNKKMPSRPILIEAEYKKSASMEGRRKLISFFNIHNKGKLTVKMNDIERMIDYEIESFKCPLINTKNPLKFLVLLYCPNPFFRELVETREDVSTETGNFSFPLHIPIEGLELSIRTINFITNIYNSGSVPTPIRVHLRAIGTVTNPIVENLDTGEFIRVNRTLSKGDTLEINTEFGNKRVEIIKQDGSRENVFHYIDYKSKFFSIDSGDTTIKYDAEVGNNNLDVYIYYTPKYLGV